MLHQLLRPFFRKTMVNDLADTFFEFTAFHINTFVQLILSIFFDEAATFCIII